MYDAYNKRIIAKNMPVLFWSNFYVNLICTHIRPSVSCLENDAAGQVCVFFVKLSKITVSQYSPSLHPSGEKLSRFGALNLAVF